MHILYFFILICLFGCEKGDLKQSSTSFNWQKIQSRDEGDPTSRYPLYDAKVPSDWIRVNPNVNDSIADTTKPLVEFTIVEGNHSARITVHNFPSNTLEERIPTMAQIERWKKQCHSIESQPVTIPESHDGFIGFFLECKYKIGEQKIQLMGWTMQLAPEFYQRLSHDNSYFSRQERADYTIKVVGPEDLILKHREAIMSFANSFELIHALPSRS